MAALGAAMRVSVSVALGATFGANLGCYSEREPPSTYRYPCDADADCGDGEGCRAGICERLCTQLTFAEDCSSTQALCFNGACTNTCELKPGTCPSAQACIDLTTFGLALGPGDNPGAAPVAVGICGRTCEPGDGLCPEGELCLEGFCVVTCDVDTECPKGFGCTPLGMCAPQGASEDTGEDDGAAPVSDSSSSSGSGSGSGGTQ